jgi:hypothetical protein
MNIVSGNVKTSYLHSLKLSAAFLFSGVSLLFYIFFGFNLFYSFLLFGAPLGFIFWISVNKMSTAEKGVLKLDVKKGVIIGIAALAAYDVTRIALYATGLVNFFPFGTFVLFGKAIIGSSSTYAATLAVGIIYHIMNGLTFSIAYTISCKNKHFVWGIIWAMFLEGCMLIAYTHWLNIVNVKDFVIISVVGHYAYGSAIGIMNYKKIGFKSIEL